MAPALPLAVALRRGGLVTLANWPLILIEFVAESLFKFILAIPIVGGVFMVAVLIGADVRTLLNEGIRSAAGLVFSLLVNAPAALASFLLALLVVAVGGSVILFVIKAGTLAMLANGERTTGDTERAVLRIDWFRRAYSYQSGTMLAAIRHYRGRAIVLAVWLNLAYLIIGGLYLAAMRASLPLTAQPGWSSAWPIIIALSSSAGLVAVAAANLAYDLVRVTMVAEDCPIGEAARRLRAFLMADARQVIGIFVVMGTIAAAATVVALLATAALALIEWVPIVGVIVVPLQAIAWVVRGLVFNFMSLMTLTAYLAQYRQFAEAGAQPAAPPLRIHA